MRKSEKTQTEELSYREKNMQKIKLKKTIIRDFEIFMATMAIIGVANLFKIFLLRKNTTSFFNLPVTNISLIVLAVLGIILKNEFFYGIGIAAMIPSSILTIDGILNGNGMLYINLILMSIGLITFLKFNMTHWTYIIIDALIYDYMIFLPGFTLSNYITARYSEVYVQLTYIFIFLSAFLSVLFMYFKHIQAIKHREHPEIKVSYPKTYFEKFIDEKISNPMWRKAVLPIAYFTGLFIIGFGKVFVPGDNTFIFTISTWTFMCALLTLFFNNKILSSEIIVVTPPMLFLMIANVDMSNGVIGAIGNELFHLFIVIVAIYAFTVKRSAKWEYILVFGIFLKIFAYLINLLFPGYIIDLHYILYIMCIDTIITTIIYFILEYKYPKMMKLNPTEGKKIQRIKITENDEFQRIKITENNGIEKIKITENDEFQRIKITENDEIKKFI